MGKRLSNLGATALRRRKRSGDPMRDFDGLPPELRRWLADAVLPWSPVSCLRIWRQARAQGADGAEALARLTRIEAAMLARDQQRRNARLATSRTAV